MNNTEKTMDKIVSLFKILGSPASQFTAAVPTPGTMAPSARS